MDSQWPLFPLNIRLLHIVSAGGMCDEKTVEYLRDLISEKQVIEDHIAGALSNNHRNNISSKGQSEHRLISQQGENESNKNAPNENSTTMSNSSTKTQSCGTSKSIAQRLLDQG